MNILVVDDDPVIVDVISELLSATNPSFKIDSTSHVGMAVSMVEKTKYDVVLTDFNMPGIDGGTFTKLVKAKLPDCKVILVTGTDALEELHLKDIAYRIVYKPINWNLLEPLINEIEQGLNKTNQ